MPITREEFSRRRTTDLETAMARGLKAVLQDAVFPAPGGTVRLLAVFDEWPGLNDGNVAPAACVLPNNDITYASPQNTPALLEDTWERRGEPGFGLYKLSEGTKDFVVQVRASTGPERAAIKGGVEEMFVDPQVLMTDAGVRYGIIRELADYYRVPARYTLISSRKPDDAESAARNVEEAEFVIRCDAPHVVVGPVQPFKLKVVVDVVEGPIP